MDYNDLWAIIGELGQGGQGKVYRVYSKLQFDIENKIFPAILSSIREIGAGAPLAEGKGEFEIFRKAVIDLIQMEDPANHAALKVLHEPKDARDFQQAEARIKNEIEAMSEISHPNLLSIIHFNIDQKWFVSKFYRRGTLSDNDNRSLFRGNFVDALRAFRPLVEAVSELHKKDFVHRDIKPQNVFLDSNNNLVLGDFGLVFFIDEAHTRISGTWENVGSRDWMPPWAMGMRIEDIKPTFDVFCLGKVLWAMVSSRPILRLWYFDRSEFNLEEMFSNAPSIKFANPLFKKCIVENEEDCLPDANALLEEVDKVLTIVDRNADLIDENIERSCKVCGIGNYQLTGDRDPIQSRHHGLDPISVAYKIFTCDHCGHVQLFSFRDDPPAWSSSKP